MARSLAGIIPQEEEQDLFVKAGGLIRRRIEMTVPTEETRESYADRVRPCAKIVEDLRQQ